MSASSYTNPEFVEQAAETARETEREDTLSRAAALEAKERLEQQREDEIETVLVDVSGEQIAMEALSGLGQKTALARRMIEAERKDDEVEMMVVLDDMIQTLADHTVHNDVFDRPFWNARDDDEIRDAYEDLGVKSRGGGDAKN